MTCDDNQASCIQVGRGAELFAGFERMLCASGCTSVQQLHAAEHEMHNLEHDLLEHALQLIAFPLQKMPVKTWRRKLSSLLILHPLIIVPEIDLPDVDGYTR